MIHIIESKAVLIELAKKAVSLNIDKRIGANRPKKVAIIPHSVAYS
jgi:hypothetical protein